MDDNIIDIKIDQKALSIKHEKRVADFMLSNFKHFKKLSSEEINKVNMFVIKFNKNNKNNKNDKITVDQCISIRSAYVKEHVIRNINKIISQIDKIKKEFKKKNIIELSEKYNHPPVSLLKLIVSHHLMRKKKRKRRGTPNKKQMRNILKSHEQFKLAEENDIFTSTDQKECQDNAELFERELEDYLKSHSIKFKTQEELVKEQIEKYGKPINTPDFLILSNLRINGKKINWIDAKNFYGANTFLVKKSKKQFKRYTNEWDYGAAIYRHGFSDKLNFKKTTLIDYSKILI